MTTSTTAEAASADYILGHDERELQRLARQASFYEEVTTGVFVRAGIGPGMRVLDLGCGSGDVSLIAAKLVGPSGSVVAIDRAPDAVRTTQLRADAAGCRWVRAEQGELETYVAQQPFDAIVGRFVFVYVRDPAVALRNLLRSLRPGGIVALHEMDCRSVRSIPELPIVREMLRWIITAYERVGFEPDMGSHLAQTYVRAGLPLPQLIGTARIESGPDAATYEYFADTLRSAQPVIEKLGIATLQEMDLDTLAARFRDAAVAANACIQNPVLVGAWARHGGA
jgi:ubiquinone/menaquinone biosynthesis C-methylase UbiE